MLNLFFFADFGCFGVELPQHNGVQFVCPLKSQKRGGGVLTLLLLAFCTGFNCIAYFINPAEIKLDLCWEYLYVFIVDYYCSGYLYSQTVGSRLDILQKFALDRGVKFRVKGKFQG